jgi:Family of unknown function (DUF5681)
MNEQHTPNKRRSAKHKPKGDYEVGYCRTPAQHRFKPGNNANPRGRRKGSKNRKVVIQDVLLEPISVRDAGEVKQMTKLEALLKKTMADALAGDKKAMAAIFAIAQREGLLTPEQVEAVDELAEDDAAIIGDYNRRVLASSPGEPGEHRQPAADVPDADFDATRPMPAQKARGHG